MSAETDAGTGAGAENWARLALPRGEWRVRVEARARLDRLGLLDVERWRSSQLNGRVVQSTRRATIMALEGGALFAKHALGSGAARGALGRRSAAATEASAAQLLAELGVRTPRFLLVGETRGSLGRAQESFLVSERLAGEPLAMMALDPALEKALVDLLLALAARRLHVPDLFAKHLFVVRTESGPSLGILDLERVEETRVLSPEALHVRHAGNLVATVPALSAEGLAAALAAPELAARIEERAELIRVRKKLPRDYGARHRYSREEAVVAYRTRSPRRHVAEERLFAAVLPPTLAGWVLDAPCGAGRFSELLASHGARPLALDLSPAMARSAARVAAAAAVGELEHLPLADGCVTGALCFRFLHHVPSPEQRRRILAELTRVSQRFLVLSFFHPVSAHNAVRWARQRLTGSTRVRHTVSPAELRRDLDALGWRITALHAQARYRRDLWALRAEPKPEQPRE